MRKVNAVAALVVGLVMTGGGCAEARQGRELDANDFARWGVEAHRRSPGTPDQERCEARFHRITEAPSNARQRDIYDQMKKAFVDACVTGKLSTPSPKVGG